MKNQACFTVLCKTDHGAALVELAFVLPILLLLVIGAVDFGRAYYTKLEVVNAAHAGAEYGSQYPKDTVGITKAAKQSASDLSSLTVPSVAYVCECSDGSLKSDSCSSKPACTANATVSATPVYKVSVTTASVYSTLVPWPGIPTTMPMSSTAVIRANYP
jgi:Flp pilus assembly protein TadG